MDDPKRILFLYSELANYFLVCVKQLQAQLNCEIHIVHWSINSEAPFRLDLEIPHTTFYNRKNLNDKKLDILVSEINPNLIYCSGWIDKGYTNVAKKHKNHIPVIGGIDTQWNGSLKQYLHSFSSRFTVQKYFSHVWIAGKPQLKYAQKLGFKPSAILQGVYAADVHFFDDIYKSALPKKSKNLPKRFIFAGRYLEFKGIYDLWEAFIKTYDHVQHDWELWCMGTGALWNKRIEHPKIKHLGFVQPLEMENYLSQTSVFVLPSHFEPWAVALHEFAAAGFPIISSNSVGSTSVFLQDNKNGYVFNSGNIDELTQCFLKFIQMPESEILEFGNLSNKLAKTMTPETWAAKIIGLL